MKRFLILCLSVCLLLSGCASLFDGSYVSTTPHQEQNGLNGSTDTQVQEYEELLSALINMAERGSKSGIIYIPMYDPEKIGSDMKKAARIALTKSPIAAYAVEEITWDLGTNSGQRAVAVNISYIHDRAEILKIRRVKNSEEAAKLIYNELGNISAGVVLYLEEFEQTDYVQLVEEFAFNNPQSVMETPQVTANVYPKAGAARVVELKFTYQNNRETLRVLKNQVASAYITSMYHVTEDATDAENFSNMYSFLMNREFGDYTIQTSNTPAYSILWHGAGDSKAFATVYASLCRLSDLNCQVITGTRDGEPWYWNLVETDGEYYHLDLLGSHGEGGFHLLTDQEMDGYVWDYSGYPATPQPTEPETKPDETEPTSTEPTATEPTETKPE